MNLLIIIGNPNPGSFSNAIAGVVSETLQKNGHDVIIHDLYAEGFNPVLPVGELSKDASLESTIKFHCEEVAIADGIVIIHPNWWGSPPAILKGWVDRVLRQGVAYTFKVNDSGEGVPVGLLRAQAVVVFTTSNTPDKREKSVFGDPLENLWKTCIFDFCGVKNFQRRNYGVMVTSTPEERKSWLEDVRKVVTTTFKEETHGG